jgi:hypothetical protein
MNRKARSAVLIPPLIAAVGYAVVVMMGHGF